MQKNWPRAAAVTISLLIGAVIYRALSPPEVQVPARVVWTWDSIWLKSIPKPCSNGSQAWCGNSKEVLGCLKVERHLFYWAVVSWSLARNMKQLPWAVTGDCDLTDNGAWHIHPANKTTDGLHLIFFKDFSGTDLETLVNSNTEVSVMTWAPHQMVAAIVWRGKLVYPVTVRIK